MTLPENVLKDIAEQLDSSMECFIDIQTGEALIFPNQDEREIAEVDDWDEMAEKVESNPGQYRQIMAMPSREGFHLMENFVETIGDREIKIRLLQALEGRKPFANFNQQLHFAGDYRKLWFDFKLQGMMEWVKKQVARIGTTDPVDDDDEDTSE